MRVISILLVSSLLTGCQFIPGTEAAQIAEAETAVKYKLADADTAKFRNERVVVTKNVGRMEKGKIVAYATFIIVCGEVNAKNQMGAFIGFLPFAYDVQRKEASIYPVNITSNDEAQTVLDFPQACAPAARQH